MNFTTRDDSLASWSNNSFGHIALVACISFLLAGCVTITPSDFGPRLGDGEVSIPEVAEALKLRDQDVLFAHTGFFDRNYDAARIKRGETTASTLAICIDRVSVLIWDKYESKYKIVWSKKIDDISKFEPPKRDSMVSDPPNRDSIVIETKPDSDGVQEIHSFVVQEWTGFPDRDGLIEAVRIFGEARDSVTDH